jgi:hypothetical protein
VKCSPNQTQPSNAKPSIVTKETPWLRRPIEKVIWRLPRIALCVNQEVASPRLHHAGGILLSEHAVHGGGLLDELRANVADDSVDCGVGGLVFWFAGKGGELVRESR